MRLFIWILMAHHDKAITRFVGGCYTNSLKLWIRLEDNKAFLANRGLQDWGDRAEIVRFEIHDTGLAMNVFGEVWIDQLLMECRSSSHLPTFLSGCPGADVNNRNRWISASPRDYIYWQGGSGFQWYDVGQRHILTNSTFRNCRNDWQYCIYSSSSSAKCSGSSVFLALTHSDQFVPELMQATKEIRYENCNTPFRFTTPVSSTSPLTISGRLQSWLDVDGTASGLNVPTQLGSMLAGNWWKMNANCVNTTVYWACPITPLDSAGSIYISYDPVQEANIGSTICPNGQGSSLKPCPVVARATHFGRVEGVDSLDIGADPKLTGPLLATAGGWFVRFSAGTPAVITLGMLQVKPQDTMLLAFPYPAGTTISIVAHGASWCSPVSSCRFSFTATTSAVNVQRGDGSLYYFDNQVLYIRPVVRSGYVVPWSSAPDLKFSRDNITIQSPNYYSFSNYDYKIVITAFCGGASVCAAQPSVAVPAALPLLVPPGTTNYPTPKPSSPITVAPTSAAPAAKPVTLGPSNSPVTKTPTKSPVTNTPTSKPTSLAPTVVPY
jgi:hypothetical protein